MGCPLLNTLLFTLKFDSFLQLYFLRQQKNYSFDLAIGIEIPFFRVSVTIEPGRSLLQFVTANCLIIQFK